MSEIAWIRSHLELLLARELEVCRVTPDDDGDYPFDAAPAIAWVSLLEVDYPMIRITAQAAWGITPTLKVFRELNDIQARCRSAAIRLAGDTVVVTQTISPVGLTQPVLSQALGAVGGVAAELGPLLAAMFDGSTPIDALESRGAGADAGADADADGPF